MPKSPVRPQAFQPAIDSSFPPRWPTYFAPLLRGMCGVINALHVCCIAFALAFALSFALAPAFALAFTSLSLSPRSDFPPLTVTIPAMRPRFQWNLGRRTLPLGDRTLVMGVLNVTPDSFSDGGRYLDPAAATAHGLALLDDGADILDIGGESTRPGTPIIQSGTEPTPAAAVTARQELDRVLPIIQAIKQQRPQSILSIDTYKSTVARTAIDAGVEIVNDVSGFLWDSAMADTIAQRPCGAILMHVRGLPHQWIDLPPEPDIVTLVREGLRERTAQALDAGIARSAIVLDPGFGFGKSLDENYPLLAHFAEFQSLGFPLLAALSRKGFLGHTLTTRFAEITAQSLNNSRSINLATEGTQTENASTPPDARDNATIAASVAAALAGAHIVRVHAVRPVVEALAIADAILRASGQAQTRPPLVEGK